MTSYQVPEAWMTEVEAFSTSLRAAGNSESTVRLRVSQLRKFARGHGRGPFEVGLDDMNEHVGREDLAPATRRSLRAALRGFYGWAHSTGRMSWNPAAGLKSIRVPRGLPRPTSDERYERAYAAADDRARLMLELGARVGLRAGEIAKAAREDVVELLVGHGLRVRGKGGRERIVPLRDEVARRLLARDPGPFFPGQIDGHLSPAYVSKLMSRALGGGGAHQTRHRFATRAMGGSGHNLRVVQELLGHSSIATTQIYTAVTDDELRLAVANI